MDAEHLHMEIINRREWADEIYELCLSLLDGTGQMPGQEHDPGGTGSYNTAMALGGIVKEWIWERARMDHRMSDGDTDLTATLYGVFLGHIPDEALGDQFYQSTRERYLA